ncbi:unnamed protein product [Brugia timori]|uniref:Transmembrane protein n=1 Tax=Brugia timori TaxID=42155 RepID=A0A0R3Q7Y5_9BILA|nr:unnamed protein product [Brugia timori]
MFFKVSVKGYSAVGSIKDYECSELLILQCNQFSFVNKLFMICIIQLKNSFIYQIQMQFVSRKLNFVFRNIFVVFGTLSYFSISHFSYSIFKTI